MARRKIMLTCLYTILGYVYEIVYLEWVNALWVNALWVVRCAKQIISNMSRAETKLLSVDTKLISACLAVVIIMQNTAV
jgi:hypothetical protein